jgi:hypothetical protein
MAINPAKMSQARLQTRGGIPYKLVKQSLDLTIDSSSMSEVYLIRATDIAAFIAESFPPPTLVGATIIPGFPRQCPGNIWLRTENLSIESVIDALPTDMWNADPSAPAGTYVDMVNVKIDYATAKPPEEHDPGDPETYLKHSVSAGGEFLMLPPKNLEGDTTGPIKDFHLPMMKVIPTIEHSLDWSYVLNPPWQSIRSQLGTVNSGTFAYFNNAPPESVLFMSLTGEQQVLTDGARPWSLSYKFSEKYFVDNGTICTWNHLYNPAKGGFERIRRKDPVSGSLSDMYSQSNFISLFQTT